MVSHDLNGPNVESETQNTVYTYDALGRLIGAAGSGGSGTQTFEIRRGDAVLVTSVLDGVTTIYRYDAENRLIGAHASGSGSSNTSETTTDTTTETTTGTGGKQETTTTTTTTTTNTTSTWRSEVWYGIYYGEAKVLRSVSDSSYTSTQESTTNTTTDARWEEKDANGTKVNMNSRTESTTQSTSTVNGGGVTRTQNTYSETGVLLHTEDNTDDWMSGGTVSVTMTTSTHVWSDQKGRERERDDGLHDHERGVARRGPSERAGPERGRGGDC
jgi:YD repeat-containing protein